MAICTADAETTSNYYGVITEYEELTVQGFGVDNKNDFYTERKKLYDYADAFKVSCSFLSQQRNYTSLSKQRRSSKSLCIEAAKWWDRQMGERVFVPEGVFIAAVLIHHIPYRHARIGTGITVG